MYYAVNKKYNNWMQELKSVLKLASLKITEHAKERADEKFVDLARLDGKVAEVVELYGEKDKAGFLVVDKLLIRVSHDAVWDACLVIAAGKLVTCYLNKKTDKHSTLKESKQTIKPSLIRNIATISVS
jgi:hypothetical protein